MATFGNQSNHSLQLRNRNISRGYIPNITIENLERSPKARRKISFSSESESELTMSDFDKSDFRDFIPDFSGVKSDYDHFIRSVNNMNSELNEAGRIRLLTMLQYKIKGEASHLYAQGGFDTWEELRIILDAKFNPVKTFEEAQDNLKTAKQRNNENTKDFVIRFQKLVIDLESATILKTTNSHVRAFLTEENRSLALRSFRNGLRPEIQAVVRSARNATLAEAYEIAVEEDALTPPSQCTYCKRFGHEEINCRTKNKFESFSQRKQTTTKFVPTCYKCNQLGHFAPNCPSHNSESRTKKNILHVEESSNKDESKNELNPSSEPNA